MEDNDYVSLEPALKSISLSDLESSIASAIKEAINSSELQ